MFSPVRQAQAKLVAIVVTIKRAINALVPVFVCLFVMLSLTARVEPSLKDTGK